MLRLPQVHWLDDLQLSAVCPQFHELAERVENAGIKFIIEPHLRFEGVQPLLCAASHT